MRKIILGGLVGFLVASVLSYADISSNLDGSKTFTYEINADEWKALEYLLKDPEAWLNHMVAYKIDRAMREAIKVEDLSDKRFEKLSKAEKDTLIKNATLKTRVERDLEVEK